MSKIPFLFPNCFPSLQSLTGSLQGENRVFPVKFFHTVKNLFSLHGTPAMKIGFSLWEKLHRENPVFITGMGLQCRKQKELSVVLYHNLVINVFRVHYLARCKRHHKEELHTTFRALRPPWGFLHQRFSIYSFFLAVLYTRVSQNVQTGKLMLATSFSD